VGSGTDKGAGEAGSVVMSDVWSSSEGGLGVE
jgi:hypothetical protein